MKRFIRQILPPVVRRWIGRRIVAHRASTLAKLSPGDAFDRIYRHGFWRQGNSLSGLGSEGKWANDYTSFVTDYIRKNGVHRIVDAGCGDFSVGSRFAGHCEQIIALDISTEIIQRNRVRFADMNNVDFRVSNLIEDPIPDCDLLLVRQVLQHLSNAQIESVLRNIEAKKLRHVLITEHSMKSGIRIEANIDLGSHSVQTRVTKGSGVDIGLPPFSRLRKVVAEFEPGPENGAEPGSVLYVYKME